MKIKRSRIWWGLGTVVIIAMLFSGRFLGGGSQYSKLTNRELALTCATGMSEMFHVHPNLQIMVNGERVPTPRGIGVKGQCMHPLHTHEEDGTLHIEAPETRDFTLGDFFAVWDKPFSKDQVLDFKADSTKAISVTVNGKEVDTYENTVLRDKDRIVISYGAKP